MHNVHLDFSSLNFGATVMLGVCGYPKSGLPENTRSFSFLVLELVFILADSASVINHQAHGTIPLSFQEELFTCLGRFTCIDV
jgi:hypothetical protein